MTLQKPYAHNHILSAHLLFLHYTNVSVHPCVAPLWYFITLNTKQPIEKNRIHIFWTHRGVPGPDNLTTLHHHCFLSMTVRLSIDQFVALSASLCVLQLRCTGIRMHCIISFLLSHNQDWDNATTLSSGISRTPQKKNLSQHSMCTVYYPGCIFGVHLRLIPSRSPQSRWV